MTKKARNTDTTNATKKHINNADIRAVKIVSKLLSNPECLRLLRSYDIEGRKITIPELQEILIKYWGPRFTRGEWTRASVENFHARVKSIKKIALILPDLRKRKRNNKIKLFDQNV